MKAQKLTWMFGIAASIFIGCTPLRMRTSPKSLPPLPPKQDTLAYVFQKSHTLDSLIWSPTSAILEEDLRSRPISIASFNIRFLGSSEKRDNKALTDLIKDYDVVVIQELVAPPYNGYYSNNIRYEPDPEVADFFKRMENAGFDHILSEGKTGPRDEKSLYQNSNYAEWFVSFYKPDVIEPAPDLAHGFLSEDRAQNPDFERVPYAFPFRSRDKSTDFVLISVHLKPNKEGEERRRQEIGAITAWVEKNNECEKDFIILGDMNIEGSIELETLMSCFPANYAALNKNCIATNTTPRTPKPYDHVMYSKPYTREDIDEEYGFRVLNLREKMEKVWPRTRAEPYPGNPYDRYKFPDAYSDHNPVFFQMLTKRDHDPCD